jgi:hypothetical protein
MSHAAAWTNVGLELITEDGTRTSIRRSMVPVTDKVSHLLAETWKSNPWRTYRLAYGLRVDEKSPRPHDETRTPTHLRWADPQLGPQYDPTIQELFAGVTRTPVLSLADGRTRIPEYYLLLSRLDVSLLQTHAQTKDAPLELDSVQKKVLKQVHRLQALYMHLPPCAVHAPAKSPARPALSRESTASPPPALPRPASPSTGKRNARGDRKHAQMLQLLAALRLCA